MKTVVETLPWRFSHTPPWAPATTRLSTLISRQVHGEVVAGTPVWG